MSGREPIHRRPPRRAGAALALLAAACSDPAPEQWPQQPPASVGLDPTHVEGTRRAALEGGGAGLVLRHGKAVLWWGDPRERFDLKSSTKSIGSLALGIALEEGWVELDTRLAECARQTELEAHGHPDAASWLEDITLLQLATHSAGFEKTGGQPGLLHAPGTRFAYSDGGANWLADCLTLASGRNLEALLFERVFSRLGIGHEDLQWRDHLYREPELGGVVRRELGSGVHAHVQAMAKIGQLMLRRGSWEGAPLLPAAFVDRATAAAPELDGLEIHGDDLRRGAAARYGLLWWSNQGGALRGVPTDAYWSWGLGDSTIAVIPSLDIVLARAGRPLGKAEGDFGHRALERMLRPLAAAAGERHTASEFSLEWAPAASVRRRGQGSDNWPLAWADDDALYTAFGDGWGFEPRVGHKLSLGFARVRGGPDDFSGTNVRSPSGERIGQGAQGEKASGMIAIDGRLYLWLRNAGNAQLGWSDDRAQSWEFADWKFEVSFGAPSFVQFGRDNADARDGYVYVISHDADSAYTPADQMVMARVPAADLREREAWEFFAGRDAAGKPRWSADLADREAVFENPGACYRSGMSWNPGLERYLWCQVLPGPHVRFDGGLSVYEAPEPWGPWRALYTSSRYDIGPGESCRFPPKWMSADGRTLYMVFSGDDSFSVRRAEITVDPDPD